VWELLDTNHTVHISRRWLGGSSGLWVYQGVLAPNLREYRTSEDNQGSIGECWQQGSQCAWHSWEHWWECWQYRRKIWQLHSQAWKCRCQACMWQWQALKSWWQLCEYQQRDCEHLESQPIRNAELRISVVCSRKATSFVGMLQVHLIIVVTTYCSTILKTHRFILYSYIFCFIGRYQYRSQHWNICTGCWQRLQST